MSPITLTILGLQPEPAHTAKNTAPHLSLPQAAWQWPKPTPKQAAPKIGFIDHWQVPVAEPTALIAKALQHRRPRAAKYPAAATCLDDLDALLLARFAPKATPQESAKHALLADLATDTALKKALSQEHGQGNQWVALSRLEPVHLQAGTDHAVVMGARYLNLSKDERQTWANDFNQWLKPDGLTWLTAASGRHYLGYTAAAAASMGAQDLPPLGCALNRNAQPLLAGDTLRGMRRWLTETQMWLYAHPLNARRAQQGRPELNSLWVWGRSHYEAEKLTGLLSGEPPIAPAPTGTLPPFIYTDSAVLAGALIASMGASALQLARNATPQCEDLPARVLTGEQPLHLIWSEPAWCYLEGDIEGWQQSLDAIEHFVQALSTHNQTKPRISLDDGLSRQWHPARTGIMGLWSRFW